MVWIDLSSDGWLVGWLLWGKVFEGNCEFLRCGFWFGGDLKMGEMECGGGEDAGFLELE